MRSIVVGILAVAAAGVAGSAQGAELAYLRAPEGEPVQLHATPPDGSAIPGAATTPIPRGALVSLDAALLEGEWAYVVALVQIQGVARPVSGFVNLDQLERVEPRQYPSGVPWAGECDAEQPYRSLMWRGNWANLAIDVPYDHAMTVVPQYSSAPLLVAYRGALARPEYQTVLAFDPTLLCTMTKGSTWIAGTLSIQVNGGEWSGSGVCCAATMAAF